MRNHALRALFACLAVAALVACGDDGGGSAGVQYVPAGDQTPPPWWQEITTDRPDAGSTGKPDGGGGPDVVEPELCRSDADCAVDSVCGVGRCDSATGECRVDPVLDGTGCDDDDPCTVDDRCQAGSCSGDRLQCDDGNPCTDDACVPGVGCEFSPAAGTPVCDDGDPCTLNDRCQAGACAGERDSACACESDGDCAAFEDGDLCNGTMRCADGGCAVDPATVVVCAAAVELCHENVCEPTTGQCVEQAAADGTQCDDGDVCFVQTVCVDGACSGTALDCDDSNACTADSCDATDGCRNVPTTDACDDGNPATINDRCRAGVCAGAPVDCDDGDPCTFDSADPTTGECRHDGGPANGTACDDGDSTTTGDVCSNGECRGIPTVCDDDNPCTVDRLDPGSGTCVYDANAADGDPCDDGRSDTVNDVCGGGRCAGVPADCDDANPCTHDEYDPTLGECRHDSDGADGQVCDDGDPCTLDDLCGGGRCMGTALVCDDANPCTLDSCVAGACLFDSAGADGTGCDDGLACTVDDTCAGGVCVGDDSGCGPCEPTFSDAVARLTSIEIAPDGLQGNALDIDGDHSTCAPAGSCEQGLDNALAPLASFANDGLVTSIEGGRLFYLLELPSWPLPRTPFSVNVYNNVALAPGDESCDHLADTCDYQVSPVDLDAECNARNHIDEVEGAMGSLAGGGVGSQLVFRWTLSEDASIDLPLEWARIEGDVDRAAGQMRGFTGIVGGAVSLAELEAALLAAPPGALPMEPEFLLDMLGMFTQLDLDLDGDGVLDAYSVALLVEGITARIDVDPCEPACAGRECGLDGCGGLCGTCGEGESCESGLCIGVCTPDCAGRDCGADGCGGSCGSCEADAWCSDEGLCIPDTCEPYCGDRICGDDGCGGSCGTCGADQNCVMGYCLLVGGDTCGELLTCVDGCGSDEMCSLSCVQQGDAEAQELFLDLANCADALCDPDDIMCIGMLCGDELQACYGDS